MMMSLSGAAWTQMLTPDREFSRADTLRGMLSDIRANYDVHYYNLDIEVIPDKKAVEGSNQIGFTLLEDLQRIQIDLFKNMNIERIVWMGKNLKFEREFNAVFVDFPEKLLKGSEHRIQVYYYGKPIEAKNAPWDGGFVWSKGESGKDWIGVACEGLGASCWWPNKDHLSDEPDSMDFSVTVPSELFAALNGQHRSTHEMDNGKTRYDWHISYPINNYNVTVNIGDYVHFGEKYQRANGTSLDLDYYVQPVNLEKAKKHFQQVGPMMDCFEKHFGEYPFNRDGFALVETPYLGMEHQGAIAYGNKYLTGYAGRDYSRIGLEFDYIIIHETGHEWWGNSVSCKDIADLWIHEGFCTYSEAVYVECLHGYETAMDYVNAKRGGVRNQKPMIGQYHVNCEGPGDIYSKGMLLVNTLRHLVPDEKWWPILKGTAEDFRHQTIHTADIENYMSEKLGRDLSKVFDQYLRKAKIPELQYSIKQKGSKLIFKYRWECEVQGFDLPIKIKSNKAGDQKWIYPSNDWQEIILPKMKVKNFEDSDINNRIGYYDVKKVAL